MSAPPRAHDAERTQVLVVHPGQRGPDRGQQRGLDLAQRPPWLPPPLLGSPSRCPPRRVAGPRGACPSSRPRRVGPGQGGPREGPPGLRSGRVPGRPLARIDDDVCTRDVEDGSVETGIQLAIPQHWLRQSARAQLAKERGHPPLPADGVLKCRELVDQALLPAAEGPFADLDQKEQALNRSPQPQRSSSAATRRKRSISSPTFTYPCMAPMARSRSVLPERPVPAMNTTVGAVVLDCGAAGPTSRSERSATCVPPV